MYKILYDPVLFTMINIVQVKIKCLVHFLKVHLYYRIPIFCYSLVCSIYTCLQISGLSPYFPFFLLYFLLGPFFSLSLQKVNIIIYFLMVIVIHYFFFSQGLCTLGSWSVCRPLWIGCRFCNWYRWWCRCARNSTAATSFRRHDSYPYFRWGKCAGFVSYLNFFPHLCFVCIVFPPLAIFYPDGDNMNVSCVCILSLPKIFNHKDMQITIPFSAPRYWVCMVWLLPSTCTPRHQAAKHSA